MPRQLHSIYVPGLGDNKVGLQRAVSSLWHWYGVTPELFQMNWSDGEAWQPKFDRLLERIDVAHKAGKAVALVGASAGASAVINAYAARKDIVVGVVCISGKVNRPEAIGQAYRRKNPAFVTSAYDCQKALKQLDGEHRRRILSRYGVMDEIVSKQDSVIEGAHNHQAWTVGHFFNIAFQLTFGAPSFIRFLKKQL